MISEWCSMKKTENVAYDKAYDFVVQIVKCVRDLQSVKMEFVLSKQLIRSGSSIGANLSAANGSISKADYMDKNQERT